MHYLCSMSVHMTCAVGLVTPASKRYSAWVGCPSGPWTLFIWTLQSFPVITVLYLCFGFVSKFVHVRAHLPECSMPGQATKPGPMLHIQFNNFFFFLCKMLIWKSKCCVYVRVNKRLRATVCSCGYRDMAEFGIWLLLRLQMEILFNVCVPESPSLFAAVYRTLHFLLWSWYRARAAMGNKITCIDVKCFFFFFFFQGFGGMD